MNSEFQTRWTTALQRLFRRPAPAATRPAEVPAGTAVYAVGDIHGRVDLLDDLLKRIGDDAAGHPADLERRLIFLGDYIDRGLTSREVVDRLLHDPLPGFKTVHLMGNHEEALLDFVAGRSDGRDWLSFGGLETLVSYNVPLRGLPSTPQARAELHEAVLELLPPAHVDFFLRCKLSHEVGDYVFVHAGVRPGVAMERQAASDLLWIRDEFLRSRRPVPGKVVVHGHTICDMPEDLGFRIDIDTGAYATGRLTCLVLRGSSRRFLMTESRSAAGWPRPQTPAAQESITQS
jgi:serine/threonine protein phosphatase 1